MAAAEISTSAANRYEQIAAKPEHVEQYIAAELAADGESNVGIAGVLGVDETTVRRDKESANADGGNEERLSVA
ncbi:MAG: hypothetical protein ABIP64_10195, partial [Burkholderiales bacterium]